MGEVVSSSFHERRLPTVATGWVTDPDRVDLLSATADLVNSATEHQLFDVQIIPVESIPGIDASNAIEEDKVGVKLGGAWTEDPVPDASFFWMMLRVVERKGWTPDFIRG